MSKYTQIRDELLADIRSGRLEPGGRLPTREELIARFSTTRATVGRALTELTHLGAIEGRRRGGTVVKGVQSRRRVAVVGNLSSPPATWAKVEPNGLAGIFNRMILAGTDLDLQFLDAAPILSEPRLLDAYEAAVWVQPGEKALARIRELGRRILVTNRYGPDLHYVSTDHRTAQREIAGRLLDAAPAEAGVYFLDPGDERFVHRERREGFLEACAARNRFYRLVATPDNFDDAVVALLDLRLPAGRPVVLISPTDQLTGAVLRMLRERGLRLGETAWYADFDNFKARETWGVAIPSVIQDYPGMGEAVVAALRQGLGAAGGVFVPYQIVGLGEV